ncbi:MAG: YnfA family protein [Verrucomicrobiota bacterium]
MRALFLYLAAAVLEIGGCFAFWVWLREGKSWAWAAAGATALMSFAWILTQIPSDFAGRTFAAYGGVYICCSLAWLWRIEGQRPDLWDALGAGCCFVGAGLILFGPRS